MTQIDDNGVPYVDADYRPACKKGDHRLWMQCGPVRVCVWCGHKGFYDGDEWKTVDLARTLDGFEDDNSEWPEGEMRWPYDCNKPMDKK